MDMLIEYMAQMAMDALFQETLEYLSLQQDTFFVAQAVLLMLLAISVWHRRRYKSRINLDIAKPPKKLILPDFISKK